MNSILERRGMVPFPPHRGERHYMVPFSPAEPLPPELSHWQCTVDAMMEGIPKQPRAAYLMIDQQLVRSGSTHRRPGLHCDGHWIESGHTPPGRHSPPHGQATQFPEAILLATTHGACMGFRGSYDESLLLPGNDASQLAETALQMESVFMDPNICWAGNAGMLHLPLPLQSDTERTVVRINVPGWAPTGLPKCVCCGTEENVHRDGWYGYRCNSTDCMVI